MGRPVSSAIATYRMTGGFLGVEQLAFSADQSTELPLCRKSYETCCAHDVGRVTWNSAAVMLLLFRADEEMPTLKDRMKVTLPPH